MKSRIYEQICSRSTLWKNARAPANFSTLLCSDAPAKVFALPQFLEKRAHLPFAMPVNLNFFGNMTQGCGGIGVAICIRNK